MNTGPSVKTKLTVDIIMLIGLMVVSAPHATGVPAHEWLSFVFVAVFITHLLMSWKWIVSVIKRFVSRLGAETRINALWDGLIYLWMLFVIVSGVVASRAALPALLPDWKPDPLWSRLHHQSSELLLPLVGIHLALHGRWIVAALRRKRKAES